LLGTTAVRYVHPDREPGAAREWRVGPNRVEHRASSGARTKVCPLADRCPDRTAQPLALRGVWIEFGENVALARLTDFVAERPGPFAIAPLEATLIVQKDQHHGDIVDDPLQQLALLAPGVFDALTLDRHGHLRGDECEDVALALPVAHALGIGLRHHHTDGAVLDLERHAEPVDRGGAD